MPSFPMTGSDRLDAYYAQTKQGDMTPAQRRRFAKKERTYLRRLVNASKHETDKYARDGVSYPETDPWDSTLPECPTCAAMPGEACVTASGNKAKAHHKAREA